MPERAEMAIFGLPLERQVVGTLLHLDVSVLVGGVLTDVTLIVRTLSPKGVEAALPAASRGVGKYRCDLRLTEPGPWLVRVEATGVAEAVEEAQVLAARSEFPATP